MRLSARALNQARPITIETNIMLNAQGSCLVKIGNTHILCSATVEEVLPPFLKGQKQGWVTAEYSMLPGSSSPRVRREVIKGQSGRTQEIQRLISRSMRAAIDLKALGERQILIDCDVINADGGTRTASITGGYVAMSLAVSKLIEQRILKVNPIYCQVAAISCGIHNGEIVVDLDYQEDRTAEIDANFVFKAPGEIIEIQATAEKNSFTDRQLNEMLKLAQLNIKHIFAIQNKSLI